MRLHALRQFALSLPHTTSVEQWGGLVIKVEGKVFLVIGLDGEIVEGLSLKCAPEEFDELTAIDGVTQAPYFAKRQWVHIGDLSAVSEEELRRLIRRSFDLVVANLPKKTQALLK